MIKRLILGLLLAAGSLLAHAAPTVSITAPAAGSSYMGAATVNLAADASDSDGSIAHVRFYRGATLIGTATTAPYTYTWTNVVPGTYNITAKATNNLGGTTTSTATSFTVTNPVTVAITAPATGAKFPSPGNVTFTATASDANSAATIAKVDYYANGTLIGTATTAPYTVNWTNVPTGKYTIKAIATDSQNLTQLSNVFSITVDNPPNITLTSPTNNASYATGSNIPITANVTDTDGTIASVKFYNGSTLLATVTSAPYTTTWNSVPQGTYTIKAVATDNLGVSTTSATAKVYVGVNAPPTVTLTSPANGANYMEPATITLSADASDSNGTISKVDFYRGATLIGTATTAPYTVTWTNVAAGSYSITARATDNNNAVTTSAAVNVMVNGNAPPTVSIASPTAGQSFTAGSNITITANAADTDGTIAKVELYQFNTLLATLTTAPYTYTWNNVPAGTYVLTARALDDNNVMTISGSITITVTPATTTGGVYYIYADHINTPRVITNSANQMVWRWDSTDPWGNNPPDENPSGLGVFNFNLRHDGQYADKETGLFHNGLRDYDPPTGRYIQSDRLGLAGGSFSTYTYADNTPVSKIDPTGELAFAPAVYYGGLALMTAAAAHYGIQGTKNAIAQQNANSSDKELQQTIEKEANRREYKNICSEPPPPGLDPCELAKWNLRKAQACKAARDENTKRWWGGADNRHSPLLAQQLENAIRNAEAAVERACKCPK